MEKMKMQSENLVDENVEKIEKLFPNCITEGRDENGQTTKFVDFDMLKQELSKVVVDGNDERYMLNWAGKKQSILTANSPINATLRPCEEESVGKDGKAGGFDSENLYIEGDNLDVLKLLRETYLNKIKMIYIDPPYNTGNDFVYNDDFATSADEYLQNSKSYDEEGNRMVQNLNSNGRFHSDWLSMMYPRLKLARDLLTQNGFIVISIDDNELFNLKKICDEIFGADNFVNNITIKMSELSGVKMKYLKKYAKLKESALIYAKNINLIDMRIEKRKKSAETLGGYLKYYSQIIKNLNDPCENWEIVPLNKYLANYNQMTEEQINVWKIEHSDRLVYRTNSRTVDNYLKQNPSAPSIMKIVNADGNDVIKWDDKEMLFLSKYIEEYIGDIWMDISTINLNKETESITFENGQKPLRLMKRFVTSMNDPNGIILDFFSGSATTAHAVMQLNAEDGGNRKFIMVQLPEKTDEKSESYKAGYKNICEIGKERIRRAGKKILEEKILKIQNEQIKQIDENTFTLNGKIQLPDIGFRVLKLDSSNMKDVYYNPADISQDLLSQLESNIKEDRSSLDLLFQVMLDMGVMLSQKIEKRSIQGKTVYIVGEYDEENQPNLVCCFDDNISEDVVTEIAKLKPIYAVFRDSSMSTDSMSVNFDQIFETYSPSTTRKVL
ncbi:MAG TPA: site-specific DNA-methyltransferase [Candidatus Onthoplasma faecipullorum]|nr:site-specific DNA-methyltransferase [Candidatus Onthoplasma faecipullorum]